MRYICKTIGEIKYLEKILNVVFEEGVYVDFNRYHYLSIFDDNFYEYCYDCCETCSDNCNQRRKNNVEEIIIVSILIREEKLKRIIQ